MPRLLKNGLLRSMLPLLETVWARPLGLGNGSRLRSGLGGVTRVGGWAGGQAQGDECEPSEFVVVHEYPFPGLESAR